MGRAEELSRLAKLAEGSRLVTLTGPPGIGKTRLALELAGELGGGYADGAALVELAPVRDGALIPGALASALSVPEVSGGRVTDDLLASLGERRVLVVLDNCEHLLGACAELVEVMLRRCPNLSIVATSREPLAVAGETVWPVPPLSLPEAAESTRPEVLMESEAVRLFVERAATVQTGFALSAYVAPDVAEICRRLDGVPLAIELAAARVESLTPAEIARRLDDRFGLLTHGSTASLRHQTLEAALDWSHDLLSEPERALLRRLSVFAGGFDFEAAEAVCAGELEHGQVSDLFARLVAKSLVAADSYDSPHARHRLLETVRAYAGDRLEEAGEVAQLRDAHARYYLRLAEEAEPQLTGPCQERWLERLDSERANLRAALEWSLSHGESERALRLAGALVLFWRVRCHFSEGRELLDAAVAAAEGGAPQLRAKALWGAGFMALMAGDPDGALPALEESLYRSRELGDPEGCARALLILGNCRQVRGEPDALSLLEESAAFAREAGDSWCLSHALTIAGFERGNTDELVEARALFEEGLHVARQAQDKQGTRAGLLGLGSVCLHQGDYRSAEALLEEAVAVTSELAESYSKATALHMLGQLHIRRGDYRRARELLEEALALMPQVGPQAARLPIVVLLARVARAQNDRGGAHLLLEEALGVAREAGRPTAPILHGMAELATDGGDLSGARRLLEEALALARVAEDKGAVAQVLHSLGQLARSEGDPRRATALHDEALELRRQLGDAPGIAASLEAIAGADPAAGGHAHSALLLGAAHALREAGGYARAPWELSSYEADVALVREALSEEQLEAAWAEGAGLSIEQAVAEAFRRGGRRGRPPSGWSSLTQSEQQVAALAAGGLTNRDIAARLLVSVSTVKSHLSHVFAKLGVTGRAELAREVGRRDQQR